MMPEDDFLWCWPATFYKPKKSTDVQAGLEQGRTNKNSQNQIKSMKSKRNFEETTEDATSIENEVSVVYDNTKNSSYKTSDYCDNINGSFLIYVSEVGHHARCRRHDSSHDSSSGQVS